MSFKEQIRRNAVALISLAVAISGLSYNTWRNEASEHNRNQRWGSFEVLLKLGELQQLVLDMHYGDGANAAADARMGWAIVLTTEDISQVLDDPIPARAAELKSVWEQHWSGLGKKEQSVDEIRAAIDSVRADTQMILRDLE